MDTNNTNMNIALYPKAGCKQRANFAEHPGDHVLFFYFFNFIIITKSFSFQPCVCAAGAQIERLLIINACMQ